MQFKQPNKRVCFCWSVYTLVIAVIVLGIGLLLIQSFALPSRLFFIFMAIWALILFLTLAIYYPQHYRRIRYAVSDDAVIVVRGLLFTVHRQIPLSAIRHITALRGPLERLTGLTTLFISASGGCLFIEGLTANEVSTLTQELL